MTAACLVVVVVVQVQQILREQSARSAKNYPYAVVANNLTLMLVDVVKLRNRAYQTHHTVGHLTHHLEWIMR
jgi:hypothetical protein